jgi:hypothetical protein
MSMRSELKRRLENLEVSDGAQDEFENMSYDELNKLVHDRLQRMVLVAGSVDAAVAEFRHNGFDDAADALERSRAEHDYPAQATRN